MKKNATLLLVLLSILLATNGFGQSSNNKELVFQPGAKHGKDAWLQSVQGLPDIANKNELDAALLTLMKETSAVIKITQGKTEISFPFLDQ